MVGSMRFDQLLLPWISLHTWPKGGCEESCDDDDDVSSMYSWSSSGVGGFEMEEEHLRGV